MKVSAATDKVNKGYGHDKLRLVSQQHNPEWPMKQNYLSPRYTTRWDDILEVK
ncbi:DUF4113 domain-containing protein [Spirosoma endophyticum]|uniref:DUF4113 domain-containing protein n=1 Tax=Spirosoma endophyticum TaxID=662367 RepID=UPI000B864BDB|nr:DUF4113 domain-containing protein [Spirosoma endophyticum]